MKRPVIFTDLDGTLLDHADYSFDAALPALQLLRERKIPLVVCSSKTRSEIDYWRRRLENVDPFIVENGGAVCIPTGYFPTLPGDLEVVRDGAYDLVRLGAPYRELRATLCDLRAAGFELRGFGDMSGAEVAEATALRPDLAEMAKEREYDEPFLFFGDDGELERLSAEVRRRGFRMTRGRFHHLLGESDKGKGVAILHRLYRENRGTDVTIALGDAPNDLPMLERVDYPVLVQQEDGRHDPSMDLPRLIRVDGIGPRGWDRAVRDLLSRL